MHLVWGIDGANWDLLTSPQFEDRIPTLSRLMESGVTGTLRSTIPAYTGIALPTILTGKNPGTTGMVGFERVDGSLQDFTDTKDETVWEIAGRQGLKTVSVGFRTTYPPRPINNGVLISGDLYTPPNADDYYYPDSLVESVKNVDGFHENLKRLDKLQAEGNVGEFFETARQTTKFRYNIFEDVISETNPELAMFWIGTADKLQHLAWDRPELLAKYYEDIDDMIRRTLDRHEPDMTYIISDHGFEEVYEKELHLNTWLAQNGYLQTTGTAYLSKYIGPIVSKYIPNEVTDTLLSTASGLRQLSTPQKEEQSASNAMTPSVTVPGIDYEQSTAVLSNEWGIDIIAERNREEIKNMLIKELKNLQINGKIIFRFVASREEVYTDGYIDRFPDIIALPTRSYHMNHSLSNSVISRTGGSPHRSGYHIYNPNGIFLAHGDDLASNEKLVLNAEDFTPTVLHGLGKGIPNDLDGNPKHEALPDTCKTKPRKIPSNQPVMPEEMEKNDTDEEVEERLRNMGYL